MICPELRGTYHIDKVRRKLKPRLAYAVNNSRYVRLTGLGERSVSAGNIKVGDLIKVSTNQRVPADMVFLRTTEKVSYGL